jgi:membrane protease YdiL (CAAX protease family)
VGPGYIFVDWEKCTECGKCASVCDRGAITVRGAAPAAAAVASRAAAPAPVPGKKAGKKAAGAAPASAPKRAFGVPDTVVAWTLPEAVLVLVVAFALLVGAQALPGGLAGAPVWAGVTLLVYDAVLAGLLYFLARRRGAGLLAAFRLDGLPEVRTTLLALVVAFGCWLFSVTYSAIARGMGLTPPASDGVGLTAVFGPGVVGMVLTIVVVALVGPLLEELLLRGVVLGAVSARIGVWPAIAACALAFALLHASLWSLLPLTVLGVGLGWLAVRSRSLWPAVLAHVLYNAVLVAAAFYSAR